MQVHHIVISDEVFGVGFCVEIKPQPQGIGHDRWFETLAEARHYAQRLSAAMHWSVHDLVEDAP